MKYYINSIKILRVKAIKKKNTLLAILILDANKILIKR